MKNSDFAVWLSELYAIRSSLSAAKVNADSERCFVAAHKLSSALDSVNEALTALENKDAVKALPMERIWNGH